LLDPAVRSQAVSLPCDKVRTVRAGSMVILYES
jgi:hypothetical protein